ncbi:hypothetical protein [Sulfolobus spindle-shaped virus]|nr:hypothetical protein [Sulfolobus spindle-shaped virus]AZG03297.1 hypothetical protein [Sulfolobus spindle-shaped virus]AZG03303.1 hypothetical protein [Sulfolobus spindle-shaped virus]AZG03363.1 hypothetical protein [Sulfolobus spindle-shaped virus]AZG03447.1 hypothetical protein [Sulfolobus spindle-shaped virus]
MYSVLFSSLIFSSFTMYVKQTVTHTPLASLNSRAFFE